MVSTITIYIISTILLALFIGFRVWEVQRGTIVFRTVRGALDRFFLRVGHSIAVMVLQLPRRFSLKRMLHIIAHHGMRWVAIFAGFMERRSHDMAMRLSMRAKEYEDTKGASDFLKKVSEHRSGLDTEEVRRNTRL